MTNSLRLTAILAGAVWISFPVLAMEPPPRVSAPLSQVPAAPYDPAADAGAAVSAALSRAASHGKFVLLDFGGNWCPDCRITAGVLSMPDVEPWVARTFELVMIDVGRMNRNLDIAARYGLTIKAVPTMVVLDSKGRMVNAGTATALQDARSMSPQAIVDTLNGWIDKAD